MANANYISASELQNTYAPFLDYTGLSATTLSGMIASASRWVDTFTNAPKGWDRETVTNETYQSGINTNTSADGNLRIALLKRPLVSADDITQIQIALGGFTTNLTLTSDGDSVLHVPAPGWEVTYPNTWLVSTGTLLTNQRLSSLRSYEYFVNLSYTAGYASIPGDIKFATALVVQSIMAKRYNAVGASMFRQGSMQIEFSRGGKQDNPLIEEAKSYLKDYVRVW